MINNFYNFITERKYVYDKKHVAGKKIIPNKQVYHTSNPINRESILKNGLVVGVGDSYSIYVGMDKDKIIPSIFASNTYDKKLWFDSTWDDDVWEIDTTKISNEWFIDKHFGEKFNLFIITFDNIPNHAIKLIYEGSGDSKY